MTTLNITPRWPTKAALFFGTAAAVALTAHAAVPVAWTATPSSPPYMPAPVPHGSTVALSVTLKGFTDPPFGDGADVRLWYQTNGMGRTWWSAPASVASNVVTATFGPGQDAGADRVSLFLGAPSNVFASAVLRLSHAPGFTPTHLSPPVLTLDFDGVVIANAPYYTKDETDERIDGATNETLRAAKDYADGAIQSAGAVTPEIVSNVVTKSFVEALGIESGIQEEADPVWASEKSGYATKGALGAANSLIAALADEVGAVSNIAGRVYAFMNGATNANFVVTNYQVTAEAEARRTHFDPADPDLDFSTVPASLRLEDSSSGTNRVVCDTRDFVVWYYAQKIVVAMSEAYSNAVETCRAWCGFTATGLENPVPDTLVVDVPNIWLMAGKTFEKHIAGTNSMWVIRSRDVVLPISDNSSVTNFLELTDAFGTPYIRFNKTESYFADPAADGIEYDDATGAWLITYGTQAKPKGGANAVLKGSTTYPGKAILKAEDDPDCPATITWTGSAGAWVMHAVPKEVGGVVPSKMFFAAVVEVEGQDFIEYLRPMSVPSFIVGGVKIVPDIPSSHPVGTVIPWKVAE